MSLPATFTPSRINCHGAVIRLITVSNAYRNNSPSRAAAPSINASAFECGEFFGCTRRADLLQNPPSKSSILCGIRKIRLDCRSDPVLKNAGEPFDFCLITLEHCFVDIRGHGIGIVRQEIAPNPIPQCFERGARDATRMLVIAAIVDDKWLQWLEEELSGLLDVMSVVTLLTKDATQFPQDQIGARDLIAAKHASLELADQHRTRAGRKFTQKLPQPLDGRVAARHPD